MSSERRRQHLANLALRSPNAGEREAARQQFLALDDSSKPLLPDLDSPNRGGSEEPPDLVMSLCRDLAVARQQLARANSSESEMAVLLGKTQAELDRMSRELDHANQELERHTGWGPAAWLIGFTVWALLSSIWWDWGALATFITAYLAANFVAKKLSLR